MELFEPRKGPLSGIWISIVLLVSLATASIVREPGDSLQHIGEVIERENRLGMFNLFSVTSFLVLMTSRPAN